jgi:plastocyanin
MPLLSVVALLLGLLALGGCGSSNGSSTPTTASTSSTPATTASTSTPTTTSTSPASTSAASSVLTLEANPEGQLKYNKTALSASAGKVSIDFTNKSPLGHNVTVESSSGKVLGATETFQGGSRTLTLELKAGTYKFFCSVPGHRQAGMEGTLTVS